MVLLFVAVNRASALSCVFFLLFWKQLDDFMSKKKRPSQFWDKGSLLRMGVPPPPTPCNENIINYPTDRPLGCGAGSSLGLFFVDGCPFLPLAPPGEGESEKTVCIHHWQAFQADKRKALACLLKNGLNWQAPHGPAAADGRLPVTSDGAFLRPSVP